MTIPMKNNWYLITIISILYMLFFLTSCSNNQSSVPDSIQSDNTEMETMDAEKKVGTESSVSFTTQWYKTYTYFEEENSGELLEIGFLDGGYIQAIIDDTVVCDCLDSEYTKEGGAYVYNSEIGDGQIKYYPKDGNYIEIVLFGESKRYYPMDNSAVTEMEADEMKRYVTDIVGGNNLMVHVRAAYFKVEYEKLWINVVCDITNCTEDVLVLDTPSYFSLNNNGVIKQGYCDYDYAQMAAKSTISTTISFTYPTNMNSNLNNMVMTVDGMDVSLADKPQSQTELNQFEGIYNRDNTSKLIVEDRYDGTYSVIKIYYAVIGNGYSFWGIDFYTTTLNSDNTFSLGNASYQWNAEAHSITDSSGGYEHIK